MRTMTELSGRARSVGTRVGGCTGHRRRDGRDDEAGKGRGCPSFVLTPKPLTGLQTSTDGGHSLARPHSARPGRWSLHLFGSCRAASSPPSAACAALGRRYGAPPSPRTADPDGVFCGGRRALRIEFATAGDGGQPPSSAAPGCVCRARHLQEVSVPPPTASSSSTPASLGVIRRSRRGRPHGTYSTLVFPI